LSLKTALVIQFNGKTIATIYRLLSFLFVNLFRSFASVLQVESLNLLAFCYGGLLKWLKLYLALPKCNKNTLFALNYSSFY